MKKFTIQFPTVFKALFKLENQQTLADGSVNVGIKKVPSSSQELGVDGKKSNGRSIVPDFIMHGRR